MPIINEIPNMAERTKVNKANTNSPSVRTTIPEGVVKDLGIKVGDTLVWRSTLQEGREGQVKVKVQVEKEEE